jgi:hypothetical protein
VPGHELGVPRDLVDRHADTHTRQEAASTPRAERAHGGGRPVEAEHDRALGSATYASTERDQHAHQRLGVVAVEADERRQHLMGRLGRGGVLDERGDRVQHLVRVGLGLVCRPLELRQLGVGQPGREPAPVPDGNGRISRPVDDQRALRDRGQRDVLCALGAVEDHAGDAIRMGPCCLDRPRSTLALTEDDGVLGGGVVEDPEQSLFGAAPEPDQPAERRESAQVGATVRVVPVGPAVPFAGQQHDVGWALAGEVVLDLARA